MTPLTTLRPLTPLLPQTPEALPTPLTPLTPRTPATPLMPAMPMTSPTTLHSTLKNQRVALVGLGMSFNFEVATPYRYSINSLNKDRVEVRRFDIACVMCTIMGGKPPTRLIASTGHRYLKLLRRGHKGAKPAACSRRMESCALSVAGFTV